MEFLVRAIRTEEDYEAALALAGTLMDAEPGTPEDEHLEIMIALIEAYEDRHWPIEDPDPIDAIRIRMEEKNLRPRDLEVMIGSRGRVSEIMSRKRALTLPMIRRLAKGLDLPAEILIQETRIPKSRRSEGPTPPTTKSRRAGHRTEAK
jgi:HTH-type transcriptional regulator / antitoxin HigA